MKSLKLFLILSVITILPLQSFSKDDDYLLKINKSFELFSAIFREIANNYVVEMDPDDLVKDGIEGMLNNLDPYTEYISEDDIENIDIISSGTYVGLGITVAIIDSMLTIVDVHDGNIAQKKGVRIGDRIYKVDSTITLYKNSDELRKYTKGKPKTSINLWLLRDGLSDTLKLDLTREEIIVKNVSYYGVLPDSIGYIKLDKFSLKSADDVKSALLDLKQKSKLNGLILDLRDNPGGLLQAAVEICELFLPENSPIVSTKGREKSTNFTYLSKNKPIDPNIPLAILINQNSASASEIVAGAIQDLDRGIVVGNRSFGKGLVQSVFDLPYNANLKITTAKYYSPSGRCLQRYNYKHGKHGTDLKIHRDSVFFTKNNRPVIEADGIIPDTTVKIDTISDYFIELIKSNCIFKFANVFTSNLTSLPEDFEINDDITGEFKQYLTDNDFSFKPEIEKKLDTIRRIAEKDEYGDRVLQNIDNLINQLESKKEDYYNESQVLLNKELLYEITRRIYSNSKVIEKLLKYDKYVNTSELLLTSRKYNLILTKKTEEKSIKVN